MVYQCWRLTFCAAVVVVVAVVLVADRFGEDDGGVAATHELLDLVLLRQQAVLPVLSAQVSVHAIYNHRTRKGSVMS